MKPFELRLAQEHARALKHLKNLTTFVNDVPRFSRLDPRQQHLMREQAVILSRYVDILGQRMSVLKIPV